MSKFRNIKFVLLLAVFLPIKSAYATDPTPIPVDVVDSVTLGTGIDDICLGDTFIWAADDSLIIKISTDPLQIIDTLSIAPKKSSAIEHRDGLLWFVCEDDSAFYSFDPVTERIVDSFYFSYPPDTGFYADYIPQALAEDDSGFWLAYGAGISPHYMAHYSYPSFDLGVVRGIHCCGEAIAIQDSFIWIGSYGCGVFAKLSYSDTLFPYILIHLPSFCQNMKIVSCGNSCMYFYSCEKLYTLFFH